MINKEEMIKLLCKSYPGLRDRIVSQASEWMSENGSILYIILIRSLSALVLERFTEGTMTIVMNFSLQWKFFLKMVTGKLKISSQQGF